MPNGDRPSKPPAGVETIFYAIKKILERKHEKGIDTVKFKPSTFGKEMKGDSVHDKHNLLTKDELNNFGDQLIKVALFWNDHRNYGEEWKCEEMGKSSVIVIKFTRVDQ